MIVVDASALIQILLRTPVAARVETALFGSPADLHAPHRLDIEIASAFRRLVANGEIDPARGAIMIGLLRHLPIERHAHIGLDNVTAYDATYVALAEMLDARLLTRDGRLARAVGHLVGVEMV